METIRLIEFGYSFLGSRSIARSVRERADDLLKAGTDVTLDFHGIEEITDSFANELLGKLLGDATLPVLDRIRFKNCSSSVKVTIQALLTEAVTPS